MFFCFDAAKKHAQYDQIISDEQNFCEVNVAKKLRLESNFHSSNEMYFCLRKIALFVFFFIPYHCTPYPRIALIFRVENIINAKKQT